MSKEAGGGKSVTDDPDVLGLFTAVEIARMRAQAEKWREEGGAASLEEFTEVNALVNYQIVQQMASGEKFLGKGGPALQMKALIEFNKLALEVLEMLRKKEKAA